MNEDFLKDVRATREEVELHGRHLQENVPALEQAVTEMQDVKEQLEEIKQLLGQASLATVDLLAAVQSHALDSDIAPTALAQAEHSRELARAVALMLDGSNNDHAQNAQASLRDAFNEARRGASACTRIPKSLGYVIKLMDTTRNALVKLMDAVDVTQEEADKVANNAHQAKSSSESASRHSHNAAAELTHYIHDTGGAADMSDR